jgi:hypothetical protein
MTMIDSTEILAGVMRLKGVPDDDINYVIDVTKTIACDLYSDAMQTGFIPSRDEIDKRFITNGVYTSNFPEILDASDRIIMELQSLREAEGVAGVFRDGLLAYCEFPDLY